MNKFDTFKVFTPTSPARLTFVERDEVNNKLVDALRTPGMQIVIYGHSGSGKTTLLINKLSQIYENHITSRCMKDISFEQLVLDAFDQLSPFYTSEKNNKDKTSLSAKLSQDYLAIQSQISAVTTSEKNEKMVRVLPPQLTAQALARFMGVANTCWVLEDFHKISNAQRAHLSQIMKVFMDMADEYTNLKIIAIGAVGTARQVIEYDPEMKNRVAEIQVPLMNSAEITKIITKGADLLNLEFKVELHEGISSFSNGMASVCHQLCLNVCTNEGVYETFEHPVTVDSEHLHSSLQKYLEQSSDTIKKAFDRAFKQEREIKYNNSKIILRALSELGQEGGSRATIYQRITRYIPSYPQGNMTRFINKLCIGGENSLLRHDLTSGNYSFKDPIYRAFALAYFSKNKWNQPQPFKNKIELDDYFEKLIVEIKGLNQITVNLTKSST